MKKNMIALAVAGALVAPVAMAEVTISGGLQAELVSVGGDGNGGANTGLYANDGMEYGAPNSGNYGFLKFASSEDLGGGMKAIAVYNMQTAVDAVLATRDAYVGLSAGSVGTILAGRLNTPYKSSTVGYDPLLMTSLQARGSFGMSALHNGYANNAIAYANSFAGDMVKVVAAVVLDEGNDISVPADTTKTNGKHAKSISVNVAPISGLDIAVAWIDASEFSDLRQTGVVGGTAAVPAGKDVAATKIGAKYSAGAFSVAGQVEMLDKGMTASGDKGNMVYLTGTFNINDANSISVGVGQADKKVNSTAAEMLAGTDDVARYMAVGFKHGFSKNTSTTVGYRISEDKAGAGDKETAFAAGLRVAF